MRESSHDQNIEIIKKRPAWPIKNPERCSQQQRCIKCFYVQRARLQKYNRLFQATLPLTQTPGSILRPAIKGAQSSQYFDRSAAANPISHRAKEETPQGPGKIANGKSGKGLNQSMDRVFRMKEELADHVGHIGINNEFIPFKNIGDQPDL